MQMQEIEKKMTEEFMAFNNGLNEIKLPKNYIKVFKIATRKVAPLVHKLGVPIIKSIKAKKEKDLTRAEVRAATNLMLNCPSEHYGETEKEADDFFESLAEIVVMTNIENNQKEQELSKKKQTMIQLAGIDVTQRTGARFSA